MTSKFEEIMAAFKACLVGPGFEVHRNVDVPLELNVGNLLILRDGTETADERPLGFQATSHEHKAELVVVVATADPDGRDQAFDDAIVYARTKLLTDPTFGGLIDGLRFRKPDAVTDSAEGTAGVKAGIIDLEFYYHTESYF